MAEAVRWLRVDVQNRRTGLAETQRAYWRSIVHQVRSAVGKRAYQAARTASTSNLMADAIAQDVLATLATWLGWRARLCAERPGRIRRAEAAQAKALADLLGAIVRLQARRRARWLERVSSDIGD
jgi:hypothetical protein